MTTRSKSTLLNAKPNREELTDLYLILSDQRQAICDVVEATGRHRELWELHHVPGYVRELKRERDELAAKLAVTELLVRIVP